MPAVAANRPEVIAFISAKFLSGHPPSRKPAQVAFASPHAQGGLEIPGFARCRGRHICLALAGGRGASRISLTLQAPEP
jgi:hypothetical protein